MFIGIGFDAHRFDDKRKLVLGGVEIPFEKGLAGHSDADVLTHAICDALLGAAGLEDMGQCFPDTSEEFKDISSLFLLEKVMEKLEKKDYVVVNLDSIIIAQRPKLFPFFNLMKENYSRILKIKDVRIGIKATTTEGLGFEGRMEGISAQAIVLLDKRS